MTRIILITLVILFASDCAGMEISRVAGCTGDVLKLRGVVDDGDFARFRSYFSSDRRIVGLDISSEGGSLFEGSQIAHMTRLKRLVTYVSKECNSVCAFIFLASRKRFVSQIARIGVHSVSNPHGGEDPRTLRDTVRLARVSAKLGIPPSTIGKMVATPPRKISYLDRDELLALKVIVRDPFVRVAADKSQPKGCNPDDKRVAPVSNQPPPKTAELKPPN
ncbi:hypothetical protein [Bradyrhizobium sp. McL0615]|uniref:COG3904 family protein n=1 Tax=Bradyrhizobium sp. McL0615 TaxID=3415673 RepID=UPI003CEDE7FF